MAVPQRRLLALECGKLSVDFGAPLVREGPRLRLEDELQAFNRIEGCGRRGIDARKSDSSRFNRALATMIASPPIVAAVSFPWLIVNVDPMRLGRPIS